MKIADGKFKYYRDRKLGSGLAGIVYRGKLLQFSILQQIGIDLHSISGEDKKGNDVAVKVMHNDSYGLRGYNVEYAAYKKLGAIGNNKKINKYGIPQILYANEVEKVLVMPKFEYSLETMPYLEIKWSEENCLQMMLDLVCIFYNDILQK